MNKKGGNVVTEREKLLAVFDLFGLELTETKTSFVATDRRFCFNEDGTLKKVVYGPPGARKVSVA
jgi:hypothetical protein